MTQTFSCEVVLMPVQPSYECIMLLEKLIIHWKRDLRFHALLPCSSQARPSYKREASLLIRADVSAPNRYLTLKRCTMEMVRLPGAGAIGVSHDTNAI